MLQLLAETIVTLQNQKCLMFSNSINLINDKRRKGINMWKGRHRSSLLRLSKALNAEVQIQPDFSYLLLHALLPCIADIRFCAVS